MKKHFIILTLVCATSALFAQSASERLKSSDLRVADNARLELEANRDVAILLDALKTETRPKIREGLLYSLGCLKCEDARKIITTTAFEKLDNSPASILALAKFGDKKALQQLADKGSKIAKTALFIIENKPEQEVLQNAILNTSDENEIVANFYNLKTDTEQGFWNSIKEIFGTTNEEFLLNYTAKSDRIAHAQCWALCRLGGENSAKKIYQIAFERPNVNPYEQLAFCKNSTNVIVDGVKAKNTVAVKAASLARMSEAECVLVEQVLQKQDAQYKKELLVALENIASQKTLDAFANKLENFNASDMPSVVRILRQAMTTVNDKSKKEFIEKLNRYRNTPVEKVVGRITK